AALVAAAYRLQSNRDVALMRFRREIHVRADRHTDIPQRASAFVHVCLPRSEAGLSDQALRAEPDAINSEQDPVMIAINKATVTSNEVASSKPPGCGLSVKPHCDAFLDMPNELSAQHTTTAAIRSRAGDRRPRTFNFTATTARGPAPVDRLDGRG